MSVSKPLIAWAVFVNTPELSPVKTALASEVGLTKARSFYEWSVARTEQTVSSLTLEHPNVIPYWAVAEGMGMANSRWRNWRRVNQGEGSLGERIHAVYSQLLVSYDRVVMFGVDSPQIGSDELGNAVTTMESSPKRFLLGRTENGGFYLFAGGEPVSGKLWSSVPWEGADTALALAAAIGENEFEFMPTNFQVETKSELLRLSSTMPEAARFL